jgi:tetratricopeptide (TPR) repeat protein
MSSRQAEAAERLRLALTATSDPPTRYLGHLFLGRLAEDRNDPANAIANYDAAIHARPRNQNARIAKARLLAASGRRSEASDITLAALTIVRSEADEPWWLYYHPDEDALSRLVMRLRGYIQ